MTGPGGNPKGSRLDRRRRAAREREAAAYGEKRDRIIASAAAAFRDAGYDATTLADIARRADTDRASLYYYASNKQDLFQHARTGMLDRNLPAAHEIAAHDVGATEKLLSLLIDHHRAAHEHGYPQWTVLLQEQRRITEADTIWTRDAVAKTRE